MHTDFTYLPTKNDLKQVVVFYGFVTNCTNDCKKKIQFYQVKKKKKKEKKGNVILQDPAQNGPVSEICFFHSLVRVNCVTFPQVVSTAQFCISGSLYLVLYFS